MCLSPADIRLGPHTLVQPDLFIIRSDPEHQLRGWSDIGTPLLAIEVRSPSTAARDRGTKRRLYLAAGVEEYWIVDMEARLVERWRSGDARPEMVDRELVWLLSTGTGGSIRVPDLFDRVER